ncbi:hypothetical protein ACTA71_008882 [Dictyostelium dimigraforme]
MKFLLEQQNTDPHGKFQKCNAEGSTCEIDPIGLYISVPIINVVMMANHVFNILLYNNCTNDIWFTNEPSSDENSCLSSQKNSFVLLTDGLKSIPKARANGCINTDLDKVQICCAYGCTCETDSISFTSLYDKGFVLICPLMIVWYLMKHFLLWFLFLYSIVKTVMETHVSLYRCSNDGKSCFPSHINYL